MSDDEQQLHPDFTLPAKDLFWAARNRLEMGYHASSGYGKEADVLPHGGVRLTLQRNGATEEWLIVGNADPWDDVRTYRLVEGEWQLQEPAPPLGAQQLITLQVVRARISRDFHPIMQGGQPRREVLNGEPCRVYEADLEDGDSYTLWISERTANFVQVAGAGAWGFDSTSFSRVGEPVTIPDPANAMQPVVANDPIEAIMADLKQEAEARKAAGS